MLSKPRLELRDQRFHPASDPAAWSIYRRLFSFAIDGGFWLAPSQVDGRFSLTNAGHLAHLCALALAMLVALSGCAAAVVGIAVGAGVLHDRRTPGSMLEDQSIEWRIADELHWPDGPGIDNHIRVTSYNQIVLLTGEVTTARARDRAGEIAQAVTKVRKVVNELAVRNRSGLGRRGRDAILTGQAKVALTRVAIAGFDPTRVKVVSMRGIVYLMGLVSFAEATAAAAQVSRVRGVKRVVKVFEYLQ